MSRASEVIQSPGAAMQALRKAVAQDTRVALPCKVLSYDAATQTISAQPLIHEKQAGQDAALPVLNDVPVYFPGGVNVAITHNVSVGDECLVIFADTSIDGWFASGSEQPGATPRRHSLSDGFALVGYRSRPKSVTIPDNYPFAIRIKMDLGWENVLYIEQYGIFHCKGARIEGVAVAENYVSKYGYEFQNSSGTNVGGVFQDMENNNNQVYIDEYTAAGKRECYLLPSPTAESNSFYNILTTKEPVTAFKDMDIVLSSLAPDVWTQQSIVQFTTPAGYVRTGISVVGGSTTSIRSYVYAQINANANWVLLYNASGSTLSGTLTLRASYILQSASKEFTQ